VLDKANGESPPKIRANAQVVLRLQPVTDIFYVSTGQINYHQMIQEKYRLMVFYFAQNLTVTGLSVDFLLRSLSA